MKELLALQDVSTVKQYLEAFYEGKYTMEEMLLRLAVCLAVENRVYRQLDRARHLKEVVEKTAPGGLLISEN